MFIHGEDDEILYSLCPIVPNENKIYNPYHKRSVQKPMTYHVDVVVGGHGELLHLSGHGRHVGSGHGAGHAGEVGHGCVGRVHLGVASHGVHGVVGRVGVARS